MGAANVTTALKTARGGLAGAMGGTLGIAGAALEFALAVKSGKNPLVAGAGAVGNALILGTMGFIPALAVTAGFALAKAGAQAAYDFNRSQSIYMRQVKQPFSHSFSHSDASISAQQRGIQAISGGRSLAGAEAGIMAQMYGRR